MDGPARADRLLLDRDVARVVLVDVQLPVEAQVLGVRPEEPFDVRLLRQQMKLLVLECLQVFAADLRRRLDLREIEVLAQARFLQARPDLEHSPSLIALVKPFASRKVKMSLEASRPARVTTKGGSKARTRRSTPLPRARRRCRARRGSARPW